MTLTLKQNGYLSNKKVIMVGSGKQSGECQARMEEYGLTDDIIRIDMLPQKKLAELYNCMDVFCFPTMRKGESLGLVGLEAMACGVPVIGSHIGGLKDYIRDGVNGYFYETGNSRDLFDKMKRFFEETDMKRMTRAAVQTAEKYDSEKVEGRLIRIFSELKVASRMKRQKICLISSSGGHLSQIKRLIPVANPFSFALITEKNTTTADLKEKYETYYLKQQDRKTKWLPILLFINSLLSLYYFLKIRPKVIITTGAGAVIPFCLVGKLLGAKIVFIESFAKVNTPTMTGKLIYKIANQFYVQWPELKKYYPNSNYRGTIY
ncbi:glycosyltransferase [Sporolactobacillus sp. THM7-7]|nr:glycosyltransferase [Sporolactobacillus sp. THM7-7]